jgi:glutaryl-CoA dehydrogenase (non-decarboxylating)
MDFRLSDEHLMVRETVRRFVENEIKPHIREWDRHGADPKVYQRMADLGLLGICIPRKWGGSGLDYIALGIACEELEYGDTFLRVVMSVHVGLTAMTLMAWGTEEQKRQFLAPQARGERLGAFCLTEPNAGSDVVGMQSTARREGDRYILNGEKIWISLAEVADQYLVVAWTDPDKKAKRDHSGLSAFFVERERAGVKPYTLKGKLGVRAGNTGGVVFENVEIPAENRIGEEGEGFKIAMFALDQGRYTVAAGAAGLIRACLDESVRYAKSGKTFGEPLAKPSTHQAENRADGGRLRNQRAAVSKGRLDEECRLAQHARDLAGKVVQHGSGAARCQRRRANLRLVWLLRRVPRGALLSQQQGRDHLRGHFGDSHAAAGGLRAGLSRG